MKLLIVCQALDKKHPVLGFFHRWVEAFATQFEEITVVALQVGEHRLPHNVSVKSLGKESGGNRLMYMMHFFKILFGSKEYDAVFVHMNPEYIVLAGWWWKLLGKKIGLWYNHTVGSLWLKIAQPFTNIVFHTSPLAYTARYRNAKQMPAGIDTEIFKPQPEINKIPKSVYFQGRIAPAKNVHVLLEAFADLNKQGEADLLTLVGPEDEAYTQPLREKYKNLIESGAVIFRGSVENSETPELYAAHTVSVNLTADGNYDKTVLESLACGTPVIVSSKAFSDAPIISIERPDATAVIEGYSSLKESNTQILGSYVSKNHALSVLAETLKKAYTV